MNIVKYVMAINPATAASFVASNHSTVGSTPREAIFLHTRDKIVHRSPASAYNKMNLYKVTGRKANKVNIKILAWIDKPIPTQNVKSVTFGVSYNGTPAHGTSLGTKGYSSYLYAQEQAIVARNSINGRKGDISKLHIYPIVEIHDETDSISWSAKEVI